MDIEGKLRIGNSFECSRVEVNTDMYRRDEDSGEIEVWKEKHPDLKSSLLTDMLEVVLQTLQGHTGVPLEKVCLDSIHVDQDNFIVRGHNVVGYMHWAVFYRRLS